MTIEKFSTISLILCAGIAHSIDMQAITPPILVLYGAVKQALTVQRPEARHLVLRVM